MLSVFVVAIIIVFELSVGYSGILLFHPMAKCVPTATILGPRHACVCYIDGVYHCQPLSAEKMENITANETAEASSRKSLPTIKYGEPCNPGQSYRMDCNRCFCTSASKLLCTQIACADLFDKKSYSIHKKLPLAARQSKTNKAQRSKKVVTIEGKENSTNKNSSLSSEKVNGNKTLMARENKSNKTIKTKKLTARENESNKTFKNKKLTAREGNANETLDDKKLVDTDNETNKTQIKKRTKTRQGKSKKTGKTNKNRYNNAKKKKQQLQDLPAGECLPGRVYKSGCKRCFCDNSRKAQCALKAEACPDRDGIIHPINTPEDVRPPFNREELKKVKTLASSSDKCDPGFKYKVTCNLCVCTERGNLLCSKELCLSFEDINRVEAAEKSGGECTQDPTPTKNGCIECKCVNKKLSCVDIPECFTDTRLKLAGGGKNNIKLKLDPLKEKCIPQGIYRDNCNRCYCQPDGTLRCTQKTCLVYSQAEELRKQLKQLKT